MLRKLSLKSFFKKSMRNELNISTIYVYKFKEIQPVNQSDKRVLNGEL